MVYATHYPEVGSARFPSVLLLLVTLTQVPSTRAAEFVAPYVDTVKEDVELILALAQVSAEDYLIDLGSGDGRFVIGAAKRGAMAHGVELNPKLVKLASQRALAAQVDDKVAFVQGDIFEADISQASVVTLYLFPEANLKLRPKLLAELKPGTRVVSNSFTMGDWSPDKRAQGRTSGGALLWIIPANVSGEWQINMGASQFNMALEQQFQTVRAAPVTVDNLEGRLALDITDLHLHGSSLRFLGKFAQETYVFSGQVEGDTIKGTAQVLATNAKNVVSWRAHRQSAHR